MSKPKQTIAQRIKARALLTHPDAMCSDGVRRDRWKAVLLIAKQQPLYLLPTFFIEREARGYAERRRDGQRREVAQPSQAGD